MSYKVNFKGSGLGPSGIRITATGYVIADGERPKNNFAIPPIVITACKKAFMQQTGCVLYKGDIPGSVEHYPTVWLGRKTP